MAQMTLIRRTRTVLLNLAQGGLRLGLVGLPLLCYSVPILGLVIESSSLFEQYQDIYIAGQPLGQVPPTVQWEQLSRLPAALLVAAVKAGPALLLGGLFSVLALALGGWLLRQRWPHWQLRRPATLAGQAGQWLALLLLAYVLGCLAHLLLPAAWFNLPVLPAVPELQAKVLREEFLWPWPTPGMAGEQAWTIYSPAVLEALGFQPLKAATIKLGALFATLLLYRRSLRRPLAVAAPESVTPV
ncbi:MAG: hypothetical protein ACRYFX_28950 [Janthinobacterium lividum]